VQRNALYSSITWLAAHLAVCLSAPVVVAAQAPSAPVDALIDRGIPSLIDIYRTLHAAPELSHHEEKSSALLANELRAAGFTVTERFGAYERQDWTAYGVVAVMKNGDGPTVLVRSDMDALPVEEKTGLPYASTVKTRNDAGQEVGVMHACGHDIHMTTLIGAGRTLAALRDQWHGTLMLVGQPAEETVDGARAMLAGGLYAKFGKPDYAVAFHDSADFDAGKIGWCPGYALAGATSLDIIVRGLGGHGSKPEATRDPVVVASQIVLALQTIVSRENSPFDPVVVTVGTIHGGTKRNIIPDEVTLQLTVRTYKEEVRAKILASIERISRGIAMAAGIPEDRAPIVKVIESEVTPATWNDPDLAERLARGLSAELGAANVVRRDPVMGSEDFGRFALEGHPIPSMMLWLGAVDPARIESSRRSGAPLPSLHSSLFAPLPEPTIRAGVKGMTTVVLELMRR
jgi:amidohydrolase